MSALHYIFVDKSVGIVTTSRITHSTPGAAYANIPSRHWEADSDITDLSGGCFDIAKQLVEQNPDIHVCDFNDIHGIICTCVTALVGFIMEWSTHFS